MLNPKYVPADPEFVDEAKKIADILGIELPELGICEEPQGYDGVFTFDEVRGIRHVLICPNARKNMPDGEFKENHFIRVLAHELRHVYQKDTWSPEDFKEQTRLAELAIWKLRTKLIITPKELIGKLWSEYVEEHNALEIEQDAEAFAFNYVSYRLGILSEKDLRVLFGLPV